MDRQGAGQVAIHEGPAVVPDRDRHVSVIGRDSVALGVFRRHFHRPHRHRARQRGTRLRGEGQLRDRLAECEHGSKPRPGQVEVPSPLRIGRPCGGRHEVLPIGPH